MKRTNFERLEANINRYFRFRAAILMRKPLFDEFHALYLQDLARGYRDSRTGRGGERPDGVPSEAYMGAINFIWEPVPVILRENGFEIGIFVRTNESGNEKLETNVSLRRMFDASSKEYHIQDEPFPVHIRVFFGELVCIGEVSESIAPFMLSVPHGHGDKFWMPAPKIQVAGFNLNL